MRLIMGTVVTAVFALSVTGCGGDDDKSDGKGEQAGGGEYCALLDGAQALATPMKPPGKTDQRALRKFVDDKLTEAAAQSRAIADAAPTEVAAEWDALATAHEQAVASSLAFLKPKNFNKWKAKPEDQRLLELFEAMLGPYAKLKEKDGEAIASHAKDECGVEME